MLPARSTSTPAARARWNASAAVVLLPFVPVTPSTRVPPCSASHRPVAVVTATAAPSSSENRTDIRHEALGDRMIVAEGEHARGIAGVRGLQRQHLGDQPRD